MSKSNFHKKWYYYYHPESDDLWRQNICISEMPEGHDELHILTKKEAKEIAKRDGLKIETQLINLKSKKMGKNKKKDKKKDKKKEQKSSGGNGTGVSLRLNGSLALSKLQHVTMTKKNKKGKKIKGLFIPIKKNHLVEGEKGVYLPINVIVKPETGEFGDDGFVSQTASSEDYKNASDEQKEEFKKLPILGNVKYFGERVERDDNTGHGGDIDEDDDLPF